MPRSSQKGLVSYGTISQAHYKRKSNEHTSTEDARTFDLSFGPFERFISALVQIKESNDLSVGSMSIPAERFKHAKDGCG
jgi:hypothetical protein